MSGRRLAAAVLVAPPSLTAPAYAGSSAEGDAEAQDHPTFVLRPDNQTNAGGSASPHGDGAGPCAVAVGAGGPFRVPPVTRCVEATAVFGPAPRTLVSYPRRCHSADA